MSRDLTCTVSGFPISEGDPVRFFLLNKQQFPRYERPSYPTGLWAPRTFPLKAKYEECGSVKEVEEGFARDLWLEGLQLDLVEVGWGDNSLRDVAVLKDLSFDQLLDALRESRVAVRRHVPPFYDDRLTDIVMAARKRKEALFPPKPVDTTDAPPLPKTKIEKGIPTLRRVIQRLKKSGLPIYQGEANDYAAGYLVDKVQTGMVRVRWKARDEHSPVTRLKEAKKRLRRYATMITPPSSGYGDEADLIVCPRPGPKNLIMPWGRDWSAYDPKKVVKVDYAMIREDVWQELLQGKVEAKRSSNNYTLQDYKCGILEYATKRRERRHAVETKEDISFRDCYDITSSDEEWGHTLHLPGAWILSRNREARNGIGPDEHWELLEAKGPVPESILNVAAEFAFITDKLEEVRYWWRPSFGIGPSHYGWAEQSDFYKRMARLAEKHHQENGGLEYGDDLGEDDGEEALNGDEGLDEDEDECDVEESPPAQ